MRAPDQCVVLIGGLGSRLGHLTAETPKPLLSVGGRPFLSYLLWNLRRHGFRRVLLLAGYRADKVRDFVQNLRPDPHFEVQCLVEPQPCGTAGALTIAADHLDEWFVLLNGDTIFDFNVLDLHRSALASPDADVHMALRHLPDASRFGVVETDKDRVIRFAPRGSSDGGLVNGGVYQISKRILPHLPASGSLEQDVLPLLASQDRVRGRTHSGFFVDIGVPESLQQAQTSVPAFMKRPAIFFDADCVLKANKSHSGQARRLEWRAGAVEAVRRVNDHGWFAFFAANQSDAARDLDCPEASHLQDELRAVGAHLDDTRLFTLQPDERIEERPFDRSESWVISADEATLTAARTAGVPHGLLLGDNDPSVAIGQVLGI